MAQSKSSEMLAQCHAKFIDHYHKVKPYLKQVEPFLRALYPYYLVAKKHCKTAHDFLAPYYHEDQVEIVMALVLLFLGGHFAMTIACVQAFKLTGWSSICKSWAELKESYKVSVLALEKDGEAREVFDSDKNGTIQSSELVMSVKEIALAETPEQKKLARRKVFLLMKCVDPGKILDALTGIWTGLIAVLATLRSRFVHCIGMGANIGRLLGDSAKPYIQPKLYEIFPDHLKWVDFGLRSASGLIGIIVSFMLIRVVSAFNSALQGATLLMANALPLIAKKTGREQELTVEQKQLATWGIAMVGFLWQLKSGFNLPFLIKVPLMPVLFVEYILNILAAI